MGLFSFLSRSTPNTPRPHLDRVHLIVHPGDGLQEDNVEEEGALLQKMADRAIALDTRNEVAVVLLQMDAEAWKKVCAPGYAGKERVLAEAIAKIQASVGRNVIVIPGAPSVLFPCLDPVLADVRKKITELGFVIDDMTAVLASGEMVTKCVPIGALYFSDYFGLKKPPVIDVNYTDAIIRQPALWSRGGIGLGMARSLNDRLRYIPIGQTEADVR